jgi:hypothetical protein
MTHSIDDILTFLHQSSEKHNLVERAKLGVRAWWDNEEDLAEYSFGYDDLRIEFKFQALAYRHAMLNYPYIDTTLALIAGDRDIGYFSLITGLDGSVIDDYLVLDELRSEDEDGHAAISD